MMRRDRHLAEKPPESGHDGKAGWNDKLMLADHSKADLTIAARGLFVTTSSGTTEYGRAQP